MKKIEYAKHSLLGLSIGDSFGDSFFGETEHVLDHIVRREIPATTKWEFTDDTVMSIGIYNQLKSNNAIIQDELANTFAANYKKDINRGYGGTAHKILREIGEEGLWKDVASSVFDGQGSMGNGGAMRSGPLGAFFYDDLTFLKKQAELAAEVTHFHMEAKVGAVAVALAAAQAINLRRTNKTISANDFIRNIYIELEDSDTKSKIGKSLDVPASYRIETVASILGNGIQLLAQDTVPFAIWCAAHHLNNYEEALWTAVSALGDRDTIGAIVGSIVILYADSSTVPQKWMDAVEKTEDSIFW